MENIKTIPENTVDELMTATYGLAVKIKESNEEEIKSLMNSTYDVASKIKEITDRYSNYRKGGRLDFNFFEGIANSGKGRDKTEYELYHSNFIAYLLNPTALHYCGFLFLDNFLQYLNTKKKFSTEKFITKNSKIEVERERKTDEIRSIDITIENKGEWIIFIENKVGSKELLHQVSDYMEFCEKSKIPCLGIYLTKDGSPPDSIPKEDIENQKILCLSYEDIIAWLKLCMPELIPYPHITSALSQYVMTINKFINLLTKPEMEDIIKYLEANPDNAKMIIQYKNELITAIDEYQYRKRAKEINSLFEDICTHLKQTCEDITKFEIDKDCGRKENTGFSISFKNFKNYDLCFTFETKNAVGLYYGFFLKEHTGSPIEIDKSPEASKMKTLITEAMDEEPDSPNSFWPWYRYFKEPYKNLSVEAQPTINIPELQEKIESTIKNILNRIKKPGIEL